MSAFEQIVVGVDGSTSSVQALEWAIGQAKLTGASIEAVTAWHIPNTYGAPLPSGDDYGTIAAETLDQAIAAARQARTGPGDDGVVISRYVARQDQAA
ncbi:MAG: universal stress protein [Actinobacteria bacterium]|nr:universal stress protein [Actinomycetota bacterium]